MALRIGTFHDRAIRLARLTRDEVSEEDMGLLYERLRDWSEESFVEVCDILETECRRFPTLSEFYRVRPRRYGYGDLDRIREDERNCKVLREDPSIRVGDEVDEHLDGMTDEEVIDLFFASGLTNRKAAEWLLGQFRLRPYSVLLRSYLRDEIAARKARESWKISTEEAEERQGLL